MRNRFADEMYRSGESRTGRYGNEPGGNEQRRRGQHGREQSWDERGMGEYRRGFSEDYDEDEGYGGESGYSYGGQGGRDDSGFWREGGGYAGGRENWSGGDGWRGRQGSRGGGDWRGGDGARGGENWRGRENWRGGESWRGAGNRQFERGAGRGGYGSGADEPWQGGQGFERSEEYAGASGSGQYGNRGQYGRFGQGQSGYQGHYGGSGMTQQSAGSWRGPVFGDRMSRQGFSGKGPKGYTRSDERIREEISDALMADDTIDASEIEVEVKNGEVTLSGSVDSRETKRSAEDLVESVQGVRNVQNSLRVQSGGGRETGLTQAVGSASRSDQSESRSTVTSGASGSGGSRNR